MYANTWWCSNCLEEKRENERNKMLQEKYAQCTKYTSKILYICKVVISIFHKKFLFYENSIIYEICYDQPPLAGFSPQSTATRSLLSTWNVPISLFPNILTSSLQLTKGTVNLITTTYIHIDRVITRKEWTSRNLPQNKDMIFCPWVFKCQETPSLLWFLKSTSLPCCNFVIVTLFLVVIAGYTCTKWDILTSENDLCPSILQDLTDVANLARRHVYWQG